MKEITKNNQVKDCKEGLTAEGTYLQGHIPITYERLKEVFGEPREFDQCKTDAEWIIKTPSGVATIYNYKDGKAYLGEEGLDKEDITEWHIGGHEKGVVEWIGNVVNPF